MFRKSLIIITLVAMGIVGLVNYLFLQNKMSNIIDSDPRNGGINVLVHYKWFVNPNTIVFDIRDVSSDKSSMDVSRVLLQLSESLKDDEYDNIILAFKGDYKFLLKGDFFEKTGKEYGIQNPIYTLRKLPQNVYNLDGSRAFPVWTGGLLGVMGKQMEDLSEFHKRWYVNSLVASN